MPAPLTKKEVISRAEITDFCLRLIKKERDKRTRTTLEVNNFNSVMAIIRNEHNRWRREKFKWREELFNASELRE